MDWPDRTHTLGCFDHSPDRAERALRRLQHFWAPGPLRPTGYRVEPISRHDADLHARRHGCASPDCPR